MVVFGQNGCIGGKSALILAEVVVLGLCGCIQEKVVVFGQKWLCSIKVVVFGKGGCIRAKVALIGQKCLYSGKSDCISDL